MRKIIACMLALTTCFVTVLSLASCSGPAPEVGELEIKNQGFDYAYVQSAASGFKYYGGRVSISSAGELAEFFTEWVYSEADGLSRYCDRYDEAFFEKNSLVLKEIPRRFDVPGTLELLFSFSKRKSPCFMFTVCARKTAQAKSLPEDESWVLILEVDKERYGEASVWVEEYTEAEEVITNDITGGELGDRIPEYGVVRGSFTDVFVSEVPVFRSVLINNSAELDEHLALMKADVPGVGLSELLNDPSFFDGKVILAVPFKVSRFNSFAFETVDANIQNGVLKLTVRCGSVLDSSPGVDVEMLYYVFDSGDIGSVGSIEITKQI